ncbi:MAG: serine hydrolase [Verrucomicrobiales bacterium]|nr:serine hydrolase [Verrucomicrobiales bacterium]
MKFLYFRRSMLHVAVTLLLSGFGTLGYGGLPKAAKAIPGQFDSLVSTGTIVGAQVVVASGDRILLSHAVGKRALASDEAVTAETLFLIASCSKPFASAAVLRLRQNEGAKFELSDRIDNWLPAFGRPTVSRAPTVAELLCHRSGIASQKDGLTADQNRVLYTFEKTLERGVDDIASWPFASQPGERYAYSGAGYCVLGRVAERIVGKPFESILQENVCIPFGLRKTTYFPAGKFTNFATGFAAAKAPHTLGEKHRWPLIGGSLYSTAEEMVRFAQGVAGFVETTDGGRFFSEVIWKELEAVRNQRNGYSLGWGTRREDGRPVRFFHAGSLQGYRSFLAFDRRTRICVATCYTLPNPRSETAATPKIRDVLRRMLDEGE